MRTRRQTDTHTHTQVHHTKNTLKNKTQPQAKRETKENKKCIEKSIRVVSAAPKTRSLGTEAKIVPAASLSCGSRAFCVTTCRFRQLPFPLRSHYMYFEPESTTVITNNPTLSCASALPISKWTYHGQELRASPPHPSLTVDCDMMTSS